MATQNTSAQRLTTLRDTTTKSEIMNLMSKVPTRYLDHVYCVLLAASKDNDFSKTSLIDGFSRSVASSMSCPDS